MKPNNKGKHETQKCGEVLTRRQPWLHKVWTGGRDVGAILHNSSVHTPQDGINSIEKPSVYWFLRA